MLFRISNAKKEKFSKTVSQETYAHIFLLSSTDELRTLKSRSMQCLSSSLPETLFFCFTALEQH